MFLILYNHLLSLLFPPLCFSCKKDGEIICNECLTSLSKSVDTPDSYIHPVFSFKDTRVKKIIHAGKYFGRKDLLVALTKESLRHLPQLPCNENTVCIPVPIHPIRRMIRGYNQTELIAKVIGDYYHIPISTQAIKKKRFTKRQVATTSRNERLHNQHNSFTIEENMNGKTIILVDDVTTTGATLASLERELMNHGAYRVYAITLAH